MGAIVDKQVGRTGRGQGKRAAATKNIKLEEIWVGRRMREIRAAKVNDFMVSLRESGVNTPLSVRISSEPSKTGSCPWVLVAGGHRLEAAKRLGWKRIRCEIFIGNDDEARAWEIRENLDRAELTALEKAEHHAGLLQIKIREVSSQDETKPGVQGGRPEGGLRAAARALGIDKMLASRAIKLAELSAKAAIRTAGLDDNQTQLLRIAKAPNEAAQLMYVATIAERGSRKAAAVGTPGEDMPERERRNKLWRTLVEMTTRHLGKDVNRFAGLAHDIGKVELIELADAIQAKRVSTAKQKSKGMQKRNFLDGKGKQLHFRMQKR